MYTQEVVDTLLSGLEPKFKPNHTLSSFEEDDEKIKNISKFFGSPECKKMESMLGLDTTRSCTFQPVERIVRGRFPFLEDLLFYELRRKFKEYFYHKKNVDDVKAVVIDVCRGENYKSDSNKEFLAFKLHDDNNLLYIVNSKKLIEKIADETDYYNSIHSFINQVIDVFNKYFNFGERKTLRDDIDYCGELIRCGFEFEFPDNTSAIFDILIPMETVLKNAKLFKYGPVNRETENMFDNVLIDLSVEFDKKKISLGELKSLKIDSVIELDSYAGSPVTIYAGGKKIGTGEMMVVNDNYGVRIKKLNN